MLLLRKADAGKLRAFALADRRARIEVLAAAALKAGPWSVTYKRPEGLNVDAGPHDYVSEGPYWFPDPKNPAGPYIRRDGVRNEARFMGNRNDLGAMCGAVSSLGMGAFFLGNSSCVERAAKVLSTWFSDPDTRMNPNLQYGQMVRGHNTGRGTGIIDTVSLIHCAQGVVLLESAGGMPASVSTGVREWFAAYAKWLHTSAHGIDEHKSGNNHGTWWTAQMAAYAAFIGDSNLRKIAWKHYREYLVPTEIRPDGSCPREEERTNSLSYSAMNLDAFALVCRLGELDGEDLWRFKTPKGSSVESAFSYLMPYMLDPDRWKKQQISKFKVDDHYFLGLAGIGLGSRQMTEAYRKCPQGASAFVQLVDLMIRA